MASKHDTLLLAAEALSEAGTALRSARGHLRTGNRYEKLKAHNRIFAATMACEKVARQLRGKFGLEG